MGVKHCVKFRTSSTVQIIQNYEQEYPHIICVEYETENLYSKNNGSIW